MDAINPVSGLQSAVQISMLKKAMEAESQPLQLIAGMQQAAQTAPVQPVDQKSMGLGSQIDVFG